MVKQRINLMTWLLAFGSSSIALAQPIEPPTQEPESLAPPSTEPEPAPETQPNPPEETGDGQAAIIIAEPTPPAEGTTSSEDIIVTGTRIRPKSVFGAAAPVDVIDRAAIDESGVQSLPELVQYLRTTQGTGVLGVTNFGGPSGYAGSGINLRGLGLGATLILINGRRLNPSGSSIIFQHFADISLVPLAAVERIEILRAGASAIYGADAVGGVVNIITRRNWTGGRSQIDARSTQRWDQGDFNASASVGSISDKAHVLLALNYNRRKELIVGERDWPDDKYRTTLSYPANFATLAGQVMTDPACGSPDGAGDDRGVFGSRRVPGPGGQGELCSVPYGENFPLIGNAERLSAFGSGQFDITNHLMFFTELMVSRFRGDNVQTPSFPIVPPFPIVPANHVDNKSGQPLLYIGSPLGRDFASGRDTSDDDTFRGVVGLKGDLEDAGEGTFLESWEWELSASVGSSRYREADRDTLRTAFQMALDSCSDPAHLENCFNPFYSASDGTGNPNSQNVIDRFRSDQVVLADHLLETYNAGTTGSIVELPGGDLGIAFGGEIRREWRTHRLDHDSNLLNYALLAGNPNAAAKRQVYSGYLELRWPVYYGIEIQTAGRLERYTDTEHSSFSPFGGLTITPADLLDDPDSAPAFRKLQLRGNVSRAFRAPTVFNTFPGFSTLPTPLTYRGQELYVAVQTSGNPNLKPETALTMSGGLFWQPIDQLTLAADYWYYDYKGRIQSEDPQQILRLQENNLALGLPNDPHVTTTASGDLESLRVTTINTTGSVRTTGLDFGIGMKLGQPETGLGQLRAGIEGTYTFTFQVPRRLVGLRLLPDGTIIGPKNCKGSAAVDLDGDPTNNAQNDREACEVAGKRNVGLGDPPTIPRLRANVPIAWSYKGHSAVVVGHVISRLEDEAPPIHDNGTFDEVPDWIVFDLQYGYAFKNVIGKELKLRVGCLNLLDRLPPVANGTDPAFVLEVHDPRGRMFYASVSAEF